MLPILNRAAGGPIPLHQSHEHAPGLTRPVSMSAKWGGYRDEPRVFDPTACATTCACCGGDDLAGVGDALARPATGLPAAPICSMTAAGRRTSWSPEPFRRVAGRLGIRVAGAARFDPAAPSYATIARRTARPHPGCVVVGGDVYEAAGPLLKALRAALGPRRPAA